MKQFKKYQQNRCLEFFEKNSIISQISHQTQMSAII